MVSLRLQQVGQSVFSAIDHANCDWRDEYKIALGILESAFERVRAEEREFLLEKLTQEDLPRVLGLLPGSALVCGFAPIVPTRAAN